MNRYSIDWSSCLSSAARSRPPLAVEEEEEEDDDERDGRAMTDRS